MHASPRMEQPVSVDDGSLFQLNSGVQCIIQMDRNAERHGIHHSMLHTHPSDVFGEMYSWTAGRHIAQGPHVKLPDGVIVQPRFQLVLSSVLIVLECGLAFSEGIAVLADTAVSSHSRLGQPCSLGLTALRTRGPCCGQAGDWDVLICKSVSYEGQSLILTCVYPETRQHSWDQLI